MPNFQIPAISFFLISLIFFTQTPFSHSLNADLHDLLPKYGFPRGLIPDNVESYSLADSGEFTIQLKSSCYVHFDRLVYYGTEIKGKISYGVIRDVSGIQAKELFLWVAVSAMKVIESDNTIEFFVGRLSRKLPEAQFEDVPACGSKAAAAAIGANRDSM